MNKENNKINCHHYNGVRGFTLIEILVVVVIIAVLATVAVSAYQRAVVKNRFSGLMPLAKTLAQGNEEYYLRNGQYTDDVDKLDIRATGNEKTQITLGNEDQHKYVLLTRDDMNNNLRMYQQKSLNFPGETHCEALINDSLANWLCRDGLKGTYIGDKYGYSVYSLSEQTMGMLNRMYVNPQFSGDLTIGDGDICVTTDAYGCTTAGWKKKITFENGAKCVANANAVSWYACQNGIFKDGGVCITNTVANRGCRSGIYDHSYCVGNSTSTPCKDSKFNNYSICYANASGACVDVEYDPTSCCYGTACTQDKCEDNQYWKTRLNEIPPAPTYP